MMTEDEAKTKWCPQYQVATSGGDVSSTFETDNRPEEHEQIGEKEWRRTGFMHPMARCIGSACMAWRLGSEAFERATGKTVRNPLERIHQGAKASDFDLRWSNTGYCGLAGRPE